MLRSLYRVSATCHCKVLAVPCVGKVKLRSLCSGDNLSQQWSPLQVQLAAKGITFRAPVRKHIAKSAGMASPPSQVVEHVVLLKVKEGTSPETTEALLAALRGLRDLDMVLELTVGPVLNSVPSGFTHALHSRYKDKAGLDAYQVHPAHRQVVVNFVLPLSDNIISIDWEASPEGTISKGELGALRIALLKPKDGLKEEDLTHLSEVVSNFKGYASETSLGANFSPARAQGYQWGFLLRFDSVTALEQLSADSKHLQLQEDKLKPLAESLIVLDLGNDSGKQAKL